MAPQKVDSVFASSIPSIASFYHQMIALVSLLEIFLSFLPS
jgi:hypothetical protein